MKRFVWLALLTVVAVGCTSDDSVPTPTEPSEVFRQDYDGTPAGGGDRVPLTQNGAATHNFIVPESANLVARITALEPDNTVVVGLGIGLWDGSACQAVPGVWNDRALLDTRVTGQATAGGSFCVRIYDSTGTLPQPTFYTINVCRTAGQPALCE